MPILDRNVRLAKTNAVVWILGFGVGGATGLALAYALFAIWRGQPSWIVTVAAFVATSCNDHRYFLAEQRGCTP